MLSFSKFFTLSLLIVSQLAKANVSTQNLPGFPDIQSIVLKNGMEVLIWPEPSAKQVGLALWYRVGSLHEKPGITGIAHLFEHMMLRPSKLAPQGALAFERTMGAEVDATTRYRTTDFGMTFQPEKLDLVLQFQADIMKNLPLDGSMLAKEKEAVRSEYLMWDNSPLMALIPELARRLFPSHIAENFVTGARADLDKISIQDCVDFYKTYYVPNNAILVLTGKVDPIQVVKKIESAFASIPRGVDAEIPVDPHSLAPAAAIAKTVPGNSYPMVLSYPLPFRTLPPVQDSALRLGFEILFNGNSSLVGDRLINKERNALDISFEDIGLGFSFVSLSLLDKKAPQALKIIDDVVGEFQKLEDASFLRFARKSEANHLRGLQTPSQRARLLGYYVTHRN